ncbi:mechanosensitive ion channel family protein [Sphingomonas crocodyli]|uniref:Mechanosensitive ion channel family protein n=1 Tax=Sphingomonas crocodyli TaxID=1979270 RepID=A0A437M8J7_9SPHN|nr:mechanosensitive ion channel family protein [Sphingomonas crocodyli]RVT94041.1 mechanosensitive ion channel family protein [Sphingomonas crocodyli]
MTAKKGDPLVEGFTPLLQSSHDLRMLWDQTLHWISINFLGIAIAATVGAIIIAALYGIRMLGLRLCRNDGMRGHWPAIIGRAVARTNLFFIVMLAARLVSGYARPPEAIDTTVRFLFTVAAAIQGAIWVRELIIGAVEQRAGSDEASTSLGSAVGIIRLLVSVICFAIAILLILDNMGVNTTGLVASLGVGGIAIGLAAQGVFSDLFAALSILFDKPFRRGDSIGWDQTTGTVEEIGLKTTRVRSVTGEEVVISNANLLNKEVRNLARLPRRRVVLAIGVIYQTSPETCRRIPEIVEEIVSGVEHAQLFRCGMTGFGASSLDFEVLVDVMSDEFAIFARARHEVCVGILERFAKEAIEFAYPTQTTFTAAPDGTMIMPYPDHAIVPVMPAEN